jgi:hypothetical protein
MQMIKFWHVPSKMFLIYYLSNKQITKPDHDNYDDGGGWIEEEEEYRHDKALETNMQYDHWTFKYTAVFCGVHLMYASTSMENLSGHEELTLFNKRKIIINNLCWESF